MQFDVLSGTGPVYERISGQIKDQIRRKVLVPEQFLPTENELARKFGVSVGTVKKALAKLSAENLIKRTRGRGTQVLAPLEFSRPRRAVLILLMDIKGSFFSEIYSGIHAELNRLGFEPILHETADSTGNEKRFIEEYRESVNGAIIFPCAERENYPLFGQLLASGLPFVFVDHYLPKLNVDAVVSDNIQGGYLATRHLLRLGHTRIAVFFGTGVVSVQHRIEGYKRALAEFGIAFDESLVFSAKESGFDAAYRLAGQFVGELRDVTAAFCLRDDCAWGCIQRLVEAGVSVPGEFSVVGYDDCDEICSRIRPRLTTVRQHLRAMGETAAKLLVRRIESGGAGEPEIVSLPVELVMRESTARVRAPAPGGKKLAAPV